MLSSHKLWPSLFSACVAFICLPLLPHPRAQFDVQQVGDAWDAEVRRPVLRVGFLVPRVVTLLYKNGGHTIFPDVFDGFQQTYFVIDHDVAMRGIQFFYAVELLLLVD